MTEESEKLFEEFVEEHADSRVIAISHHIEFLIEDILKHERRHAELSARWLSGEEIMNRVKWKA